MNLQVGYQDSIPSVDAGSCGFGVSGSPETETSTLNPKTYILNPRPPKNRKHNLSLKVQGLARQRVSKAEALHEPEALNRKL